jgi:dipeptidyl aminopeptidase/acylaminoacyl peptidase
MRTVIWNSFVGAAVVALGITPGKALRAQETAGDNLLNVKHYLDWETAGDPQISPDGTQIVYARRWINQQEDRWESALWIMNADGTKHRFLLKGSSPRWSPDGTRIAYVGETDGKAQVFVRWMDAEGAISQITRVTDGPASLAWSPDGKWLSFTMPVPFDETWKIAMPAMPPGAKWTPAPRRVTKLHYRQDRAGFMESAYTQLFVVSADGGTPRQLTSGEFNVGARFDQLGLGAEYSWTPDGKQIVFDGFREPEADYNYRNSNLYAVDVATGSTKRLTPKPGTWTNPVVSPDGRSIAFAGYDSTRKSYQTSELYFAGIDGSNPHLASGDLDRDVNGIIWAPDGSGVYATVADRGASNVIFVSTRGERKPVTQGTHMLALSAVSKNGIAVGTRSAAHDPGDIVKFSLLRPAEVTKLTDVNGDVLAGVKLGDVDEFWYPSAAGTKVQGWIVKPPGFDPKQKYPLIMEIHGGPHGMYNGSFSYMFQNFAANGYVVLYTNPRGSTGYGTPFGNAIERQYPGVDYDDLMAGVDTIVGRGYVDTKKMYVGGCSGGGVLSSWVIGHTTRFAGAAVRCPVIDWLSMGGQSDVPLFTYNFFEKPFWDDPMPWLKQSSIMYVKNVRTPTLLMTGELDLRTPMPQTEEYFAALKMLHVPTEILRFQGEYHGTSSKPSNFIRTQLYMMGWYQKWTAKGTPTTEP